MLFSSEKHVELAKLLRAKANWLSQHERMEAVKKSNSFLAAAVLAAQARGGIATSGFDFDALNPDWTIIDDQVRRLLPVQEPVSEIEGSETSELDHERPEQIRQLIKQAIEAPTAQGITDFLEFTTKFRRLSVWNARMAYIQRPGARVIASEFEWQKVGRRVVPDAIPIFILWPFSPTRFVYELEDTSPPIEHDDLNDPFAAIGEFQPGVLVRLMKGLGQQKNFNIKIVPRRFGSGQAGSASSQGNLPMAAPFGEGIAFGKFASENAETDCGPPTGNGIPTFRVAVNDRLQPGERFATIAHELGHIFCGHLGPCNSRNGKSEESGWPDRRSVKLAAREVEAEAVAFLVASRAGLTTGSAAYLKGHAQRADMKSIDIDLVVRAAARIERLAKIHYGSMAFHDKAQLIS